ncbi:hypothetical protein KEJ23_07420, partial [Candidatus Bathyarchaeota archaeon]|nr:hypothetical protein [Candidatus Bathyarchaeota archaeon]
MREIRIGLPTLPYLRYLFLSFARLVNYYDADVILERDAILIRSRGTDVRKNLARAFDYAVELMREYMNRYRTPAEFPLSGNDRAKVIPKLVKALGLREEIRFSEMLEAYAESVERIALSLLQNSLYPFKNNGQLAPLAAFAADSYGYTRSPYFDGKYKLQIRLNPNQSCICIAGYAAARSFRARWGDNWIAVLIFPLTFNIVKYDFYRVLRNSLGQIPGFMPEEALVLWFALHLPPDFPDDILVLGLGEPRGNKPASVGPSIPLHITSFMDRSQKALDLLKSSLMKSRVEELLRLALQKGMEGKATRPESAIDDAVNYSKLLFVAIQDFDEKKLEFLLRSSRTESQTFGSEDSNVKKRYQTSLTARLIAMELLKSYFT